MVINLIVCRQSCLKLRMAVIGLVINFPKSLWSLLTRSKRAWCLERSSRQIVSRGNSIYRRLMQ